MKILPVISRPLYKDMPERKHDAPKSVSVRAKQSAVKQYNVRNNPGVSKSDDKFIRQIYHALLLINRLLKKAYPSFAQTEVIKISFHKWVRLAARERSRHRKQVLQTGCQNISDKQQNLNELVADLELEDVINKPVMLSHHDVAEWVWALKKHESDKLRFSEQKEQMTNALLADKYFDALKQKNLEDARFLREKTFSKTPIKSVQEDVDLQELYEDTHNMRNVISAYNLTRTK